MNPKPLKILFISTGNAARSILAEALLNHKRSDRFQARSAGLRPTLQIHEQTLALLAEESIHADGLHCKGWNEFFAAARIVPMDIIVTLSEDARQNIPTWPGDPVRVHWAVDDPLAAEKADVREWKFRKCLNTLQLRIDALVRAPVAASACELLVQMKDIGMVV